MDNPFEPGRLARVIRDYQASDPDPLIMRAGERLALGRRDSQWPAYVWCTNRQGKGGWVPEAYLDRHGEQGIARRDYSAAELSAAAGEQLVLEGEAGGWYWATAPSGQSGWIPAEHVEVLPKT